MPIVRGTRGTVEHTVAVGVYVQVNDQNAGHDVRPATG